MSDHCVQILGGAAVIHPQEAVWLAAAAAEIPRQHIPPATGKGGGHTADVVRLHVRLQPVGEDRESLAAVSRPCQIDEISVGEFETLRVHRQGRNPTEQRGKDRLQMPARQPRRRAVRGVGNHWHGRAATLGRPRHTAIA